MPFVSVVSVISIQECVPVGRLDYNDRLGEICL